MHVLHPWHALKTGREQLLAAANVFQLRHESLEIAGGQREQKPIAGQSDKAFITLNRARIALVPKETRCDANLLSVRSAQGEHVCNGKRNPAYR
jgi:hypothetical protein